MEPRVPSVLLQLCKPIYALSTPEAGPGGGHGPSFGEPQAFHQQGRSFSKADTVYYPLHV